MYQAHLIISGRVQGVCYRVSCRDFAGGQGLKGWVRNLDNGCVEALAQGQKDKIEKFIEWCKIGPPSAKVEEVKITWEEASGQFNGFSVIK